MTTPTAGFAPGDILTRAQIHPVLGGSSFQGICPAVEKRNVLIFSDSKIGKRYGYRDGWLAENDASGPIFTYTGVGQRGDQTLDGGNAAILNHANMGRTLHVFVAVGNVPGTGTRKHKYIGEFKVDERTPYDIREAKDELNHDRNVIVFRLRPTGPFIREDSDTLPLASRSRIRFQSTAGRVARAYRRQRRQRQPQTETTRIESIRDELADAFEAHESAAGMDIGQMELSLQNSTDQISFEIYNQTNHTVYQPTGSAAPESITQALAQLLHAQRHLKDLVPDQPFHLMMLTPALPREDLRGLLADHGIGLVYRNDNGGFSEFAGSTPMSSDARSFRCLNCPVPAA
ncbi:hypothetical protein [Streptomyces lanatus]|uniref:ScoMcrA-like SRA domain-containing protein n=1 Tax=Streptomyces lanatus TaxID=66900 RepID=A0ABV1Y159_9ACTN|nr:hypothetical protein [Streptomyces lanatus]GHH24281.1 hypothetical protein GCM10018780_74400 [Streptomyces lanatus]